MTIEPHLKNGAIGVQEVQDGISVLFLTGSEGNYLVNFFELKETLHQARSNIYVYDFCSMFILYLYFELSFHGLWVSLIDCVDHGFVDVED